MQRRARISENQADQIVDDEDEPECETEIEQGGDEQKRHLHSSHDPDRNAAAGFKGRKEMDIGIAVVHGNFPCFAINNRCIFLFPEQAVFCSGLSRGRKFLGKPQSMQYHPASVHPRIKSRPHNSIKHN